ncbi:MAG: hypothetical protein M3Z25_23410 [Actinomycetota bacterium]|nr:hypothetical protein [Actinomycetota bacterium]
MDLTWGISEPTFLAGYSALAVLTFAVVLALRRVRGPSLATVRVERAEDAAFLAGGRPRVVLSAVPALGWCCRRLRHVLGWKPSRRWHDGTVLIAPLPPAPIARRAPWALAAVAALGGIRIVAVAVHGHPIGVLDKVAAWAGLAAFVLALVPPLASRRTGADEQLARLRQEYAHLNPALSPSWTTAGRPARRWASPCTGQPRCRQPSPHSPRP